MSGDVPNRAPKSAEEPDLPYRVVWNDVVSPSHLGASIVVCVIIGLPAFLIARVLLAQVVDRPALAGGIALLLGLLGCVVGAAICARLFPPKRVLAEEGQADLSAARSVLAAQGGSLEEFAALPAEVRQEMQALGLAPEGRDQP